jgi:hypothetical protein
MMRSISEITANVPIQTKTGAFDSMQDACARLGISRQTLLRYLADGFFSEAPRHKQGRSKFVRYFPESWYTENEPKLADAPTPSPSVANQSDDEEAAGESHISVNEPGSPGGESGGG